MSRPANPRRPRESPVRDLTSMLSCRLHRVKRKNRISQSGPDRVDDRFHLRRLLVDDRGNQTFVLKQMNHRIADFGDRALVIPNLCRIRIPIYEQLLDVAEWNLRKTFVSFAVIPVFEGGPRPLLPYGADRNFKRFQSGGGWQPNI